MPEEHEEEGQDVKRGEESDIKPARVQRVLRHVGLVGCGEIANSYVPCLMACGGRVTHLYDSDLARAREFSSNGGPAAGASVCSNLAELLACDQIDIVLNLTPVESHFAVSHACLAAGKHVWSEKPLAQTPEDAQCLVALARSKGLELGCSPLTYWGEAQQTMARHLEAGLVGTVRFVQVSLVSIVWPSGFEYRVSGLGSVFLFASLKERKRIRVLVRAAMYMHACIAHL